MTIGRPDTPTFRWLAGILVTIVIALVAFWARDLSGQVSSLGGIVRDQSLITAEMRGQLSEITGRLKRIEDNQDAEVLMGRRRTR